MQVLVPKGLAAARQPRAWERGVTWLFSKRNGAQSRRGGASWMAAGRMVFLGERPRLVGGQRCCTWGDPSSSPEVLPARWSTDHGSVATSSGFSGARAWTPGRPRVHGVVQRVARRALRLGLPLPVRSHRRIDMFGEPGHDREHLGRILSHDVLLDVKPLATPEPARPQAQPVDAQRGANVVFAPDGRATPSAWAIGCDATRAAAPSGWRSSNAPIRTGPFPLGPGAARSPSGSGSRADPRAPLTSVRAGSAARARGSGGGGAGASRRSSRPGTGRGSRRPRPRGAGRSRLPRRPCRRARSGPPPSR
jgi:hypothetical protein